MGYWTDRFQREYDALYDRSLEATTQELTEQYRRVAKEIVQEMENLFLKLQNENAETRANDLYRYNRLYKLLGEVNKKLRALGEAQIETLKPQMEQLYKDTAALVGHGFGFTTAPRQLAVVQIINRIWCADGQHWSDRLWTDKRRLVQALEEGLLDCVIKGSSHEELTKTLMQRFDQSYSRAERLARTELSYIQTQATLAQYKQEGVGLYYILDAGDYPGSGAHPERECMECHELALAGPYEIKKAVAGKNLPPIHPNCRCCIIPYAEGVEDYTAKMSEAELKAERKKLQNKALTKTNKNNFATKEALELRKLRNSDKITSGARITDPDSPEAKAFAKSYYEEIRHFTTDVKRIAQNTGYKESDIAKIKDYLFYTPEFSPDCAIAHSWQRLFSNDKIKKHDYTLLKHELYEIQIKEQNPEIAHDEAHTMATLKYNYQEEADKYYGNLAKLKNK